MKITINWCKNQTSKNGKAYMTANISDEQGLFHDVSIWPDFPYYADIKSGSIVEGTITQKGQYKNLTSGSRALNPNYKGAQIEAAQDRKAGFIREAQDRKEESIAFFNATNSAIALLASKNLDGAELRLKIKEWRTWFLEEWKEWDKKPVEAKREPF